MLLVSFPSDSYIRAAYVQCIWVLLNRVVASYKLYAAEYESWEVVLRKHDSWENTTPVISTNSGSNTNRLTNLELCSTYRHAWQPRDDLQSKASWGKAANAEGVGKSNNNAKPCTYLAGKGFQKDDQWMSAALATTIKYEISLKATTTQSMSVESRGCSVPAKERSRHNYLPCSSPVVGSLHKALLQGRHANAGFWKRLTTKIGTS